ncbi:MAG TPA: D-alanyl-D-alanine carboxypeptidase family protein [Clostridia bacterium]|nr:D-alanyl-D-alanine carboxypeptidase family protein [Clostridia bacterium]
MKRIISMFLVLICIVGFVNPVLAEPEDKVNINVLPNEPGSVSTLKDSDILVESPEIESQSGILMDIESGEFLFSKDSNKKVYPASTTKVLTALIALENGDLDEIVTVGTEAYLCAKDSSLAAIDIGEEISLKNLLYGLMLPSGNDAAYTIAVHIGRKIKDDPELSIEESLRVFIDNMNHRTEELGATGSHFVTPDGYHDDDHYTTAHDMALIAQEAMTHDIFREIISTKIFTMDDWSSLHDPNVEEEEKEIRYWWNSNALIQPNGNFYYPNSIGGKTGYTSKSLHCLVSSAASEGMELIAVVLGASKHGKWTDSISLFDYGFDNFELYKPFSPDQQINVLNVDNNPDDDSVSILINKSPVHVILKNEIKDIKQEIEWVQEVVQKQEDGKNLLSLSAPISRSQKVGTLTLKLNGKVIDEIDLITAKAVRKIEPTKPKTSKKSKTPKKPNDTTIERSNSWNSLTIWGRLGIGIVGFILLAFVVFIISVRNRKKGYMYYRRRY